MNITGLIPLGLKAWKVINHGRKAGIAGGIVFAVVEFKTDLVSLIAPLLADPEVYALLSGNGLPTDPSVVVAVLGALVATGTVYVTRNTPLGGKRAADDVRGQIGSFTDPQVPANPPLITEPKVYTETNPFAPKLPPQEKDHR